MNQRKLLQVARKCPGDAKQFIQQLPAYYRNNFEKSAVREYPLLITAAMNNYADLIAVLIKQYKLNLEEECDLFIKREKVEGATALWIACLQSHFPTVKVLIQNGAQVFH